MQDESEEKILIELLIPHSNKNHIIYFDKKLLTRKIIRALQNRKIYSVGFINDDTNTYGIGLYASSLTILEKMENGHLFYYPKINCEDLKQKYENEISRASKRVTFIELY